MRNFSIGGIAPYAPPAGMCLVYPYLFFQFLQACCHYSTIRALSGVNIPSSNAKSFFIL